MGASQFIYIVIVAAIFIGYYLYNQNKFKAKGGVAGYLKEQYGLDEGEELVSFYNANFHIDKGLGDVAQLLTGTERVGKTLQIGITNKDRLVISFVRTKILSAKDKPYQFIRDQIKSIEVYEAKKVSEKFSTSFGRVVILIQLNNGEEFKLDVDKAGVEAIQQWFKMKKSQK